MPKLNKDLVTRIFGVVGEILITIGAVVLLFLAWQLWINNEVIAVQQKAATEELSQSWRDSSASSPTPQPGEDYGPAPVAEPVGDGVKFATIYIPRLGPDSGRTIANSVDPASVLNRGMYGHYPDTNWPGQNGNFALAVHRTSWGSPFADVVKLETGDPIYVETEEGYYTYTFRNYEFVLPTAVSVLQPIPGTNAAPVEQSLITITTCNPLMGDAERLISYGVLTSWQPRSAGAPKGLTEYLERGAN